MDQLTKIHVMKSTGEQIVKKFSYIRFFKTKIGMLIPKLESGYL